MLLAHGLTESMVARGRGHLLFMSSLSGRAASPGTSVYAATKFGLRGFALALREDLAPKGVGVSVDPARLHQRRRDVRRVRRQAPALRRHQAPGGRRARRREGDRVQPRRARRRPAPPLRARRRASLDRALGAPAPHSAGDRSAKARRAYARRARAQRRASGPARRASAERCAPARARRVVAGARSRATAPRRTSSRRAAGPSASRASSGVAWIRTTTSSASSSSSEIDGAPRIGVSIAASSIDWTSLGRTSGRRRARRSTDGGLAQRDDRGREHDVVGHHHLSRRPWRASCRAGRARRRRPRSGPRGRRPGGARGRRP